MAFDSWKGSLRELKGQIKQTWGKLTEDDLKYVEGNFDELVGRIQKGYGEKKEDIMSKIDAMKSKYLSDDDDKDDEEVKSRYQSNSDKSPRSAHSRSDREL